MHFMGKSVIPTLVYADIEAAHDFLVRAFGFESGGIERDGQGRVVHGEVRTGESVIWLHRVIAEHKLASPASLEAASSGLVVYVDDIDSHYNQARRAGAVIEREPEDMTYGQREYGARDPEGHRWWFAAPLRPTDEPIAEG
jgi:uncharacterized glyoxalase superfamily protein PhnB